MKGPPPKPASQRARRNKASTNARFETDELPIGEAPDLGEHPEGEHWHPRTLQFWRDVWESPMAPEFLRADTGGLFVLATLVDQFWKKPSPYLAAEIRQSRKDFGLTPMDRRRLQWEIVRTEDALRKRPNPPVAPKKGGDPRLKLA